MCNLTEMYRNSHIFKDDKLKQYKEFQQHCHDQAVVGKSYQDLKMLKLKIVESADNVDSDEVAHHELPHQDQHCLPSSL